MGYTTTFNGAVYVDPPLNEHEQAFLRDFSGSRRMDRSEGPYYADPGTDFGQTKTDGVRNYNGPPAGQPGLWCQWLPGRSWDKDVEGDCIEWDGGEKFYNAPEWMEYIIDHFFVAGAAASRDLQASIKQDPRFAHFTFDHVFNGEIEAQGEDPDDRWKLIVRDNKVQTVQAQIVWPEPT